MGVALCRIYKHHFSYPCFWIHFYSWLRWIELMKYYKWKFFWFMLLVTQNASEAGGLLPYPLGLWNAQLPWLMCSSCVLCAHKKNDHLSVGEKFNFLSPQDILSATGTLLPAFRKQRFVWEITRRSNLKYCTRSFSVKADGYRHKHCPSVCNGLMAVSIQEVEGFLNGTSRPVFQGPWWWWWGHLEKIPLKDFSQSVWPLWF